MELKIPFEERVGSGVISPSHRFHGNNFGILFQGKEEYYSSYLQLKYMH